MITKELKSTKAITLIAMVISILVLLILAGVSVSLVVGETGITQRAVTAKKTYDIAGAKEQVELLVEGYIGDYYGKKYTSGESVSQDIGTYVATQLASDTTVGDYALEMSGTNVALKKGEETVAKGKINSSGGLEWFNGTEKIVLLKVSDESSAKDASVGEEVKIGDENFYVIKADDTTLTMLAKYNLATTPNESTGKYEQLNATFQTTGCAFSSINYWIDDWKSYYAEDKEDWEEYEVSQWDSTNGMNVMVPHKRWIGAEMNLNECEMPTTGENIQTFNNNAILKARKYGEDLGTTGRLLTYEEVNAIENGTNNELKKQKNGEDSIDGYLYYWLGTATSYDDSCVYCMYWARLELSRVF